MVVSNPPAPAVDARLIVNERARGFAANANRGIAETTAPFVVIANPDTEASPGAVAAPPRLRRGTPALRHRRAAPAQLRRHGCSPLAGGSRPSRDTIVRRTPLRRDPQPADNGSAATICSSSGPSSRRSPTGCSARFCSCAGRCSTSSGGFDEGFRLYGEDIDLCYRAKQAGWERWYVPQAAVRHAHAAVTDRRFLTRQTLWHWRSIARFVRKHPERLRNI